MHKPKRIILMSGKRKCGKDFIAEAMIERLKERATIVRISEPLKSQYAEQHNLDLKALMTAGSFKEVHRKNMIDWSETLRMKIPGYFCQLACEQAPHCDIWIVSDIRRKSDIEWFSNQFKDIIKTVRIITDSSIREQRGWKFTTGVDDVASECNLDDYSTWDLIINNDGQRATEEIVDSIENLIEMR